MRIKAIKVEHKPFIHIEAKPEEMDTVCLVVGQMCLPCVVSIEEPTFTTGRDFGDEMPLVGQVIAG